MQPAYDIQRSYEENYREGPFILAEAPPRARLPKQRFLGFSVNSRVGIPAGPLLNARWIAAYARMGFDLLVYKTVRTRAMPSHPHPNCVVLEIDRQIEEGDFGKPLTTAVRETHDAERVSITNSFGMPSRDPAVWQEDLGRAAASLQAGQLLIASVVGTAGEGDLAQDYARAAQMAVEAGAPVIEINLSCPNVVTPEGAVYADPVLSSHISKAVKQAIGPIPLIIKIGYIRDVARLARMVAANAPHIQAISGLNTLSFEVMRPDGAPALTGRPRAGVCGAAIRQCALSQSARLIEMIRREKYDLSVIGVGGVMTPAHIRDFLNLGVDAVMSATGAMWDPLLAHRYETGG
jgi:dihydroorotate dehydrogenase